MPAGGLGGCLTRYRRLLAMVRSDEETEFDLGPALRRRQAIGAPDCPRADAHGKGPRQEDLSPAGFKGGQGRTAEEVEENAAGAGVLLALLVATGLVLYILHRLGAF